MVTGPRMYRDEESLKRSGLKVPKNIWQIEAINVKGWPDWMSQAASMKRISEEVSFILKNGGIVTSITKIK